MKESKYSNRPFLLVIIMMALAFAIVGVTTYLNYQSTMHYLKQKFEDRLTSQIALAESVADFDRRSYKDPLKARRATLGQFLEGHNKLSGFGKSGEFVIANKKNNKINWLKKKQRFTKERLKPVPLKGKDQKSEAMRLALQGMRGVKLGFDYRGVEVLAAYAYIKDLNIGLVIKKDLWEIQEPFIQTVLYSLLISLIIIFAGAALFFRITNPLLVQIETNSRQLKNFISNLPGAAYRSRFDANSTLEYLSEGAEKLTGYSHNEYLQNPTLNLTKLIHPEDKDFAETEMLRGVKNQTPWEIEYRILSKGDIVRWVHERGQANYGGSGEILHMDGLLLDITDRKASEEKLEKQTMEAKLIHQVTEMTEESKSFEDSLNYCINLICRMNNWPVGHAYLPNPQDKTELQSANIWYLSEPEKYQPLKEITDATTYEKGFGLPGEIYQTAKPKWVIDNSQDSKRFPRAAVGNKLDLCSEMGLPIILNGEPVAVLEFWAKSMVEDDELLDVLENVAYQLGRVLERKLAQEEVDQTKKFLEGYIENSNAIMYAKSIEGKYILVNQKWEDVVNYDKHKAIGKTDHDIFPGDVATNLLENDREVALSKKPVSCEEIINQEGKIRTFISNKFPVIDNFGKVTAICGISQEITEQKIIEEELKAAKKVADEANNAKSMFLANMSHEIRTPMNAILGFSEILQRKVHDEKLKKFVTSINSSGKALLRLINDILDLSKVEAGKLELEYAPVDPQMLFLDFENIFQQKALDKGLDFKLKIDPDIPKSLLMDETRIRQIITNLIGNALKFTSNGFILLNVDSIPGEHTSSVDLLIKVKDTGIGIPPEQLDKIFGVFEQVDGQSNAKYGGTGLGLSITRKLVDLMKGEIKVASEPGKGSTFIVKIPRVSIAATTKENEQGRSVENFDFDAAKILLVDDIEANRNLINSYFDETNFTVIEAVNGQQAVDTARREMPDLILMDVKMPVMDGIQASTILKQDQQTKDIPIVILTASSNEETEKEIEKICEGHLKKPVSIKDLFNEMAKYLSTNQKNSLSQNQDQDQNQPHLRKAA